MSKNTCNPRGKSRSVSEEALQHNTEDEDSSQGMEPYLVRRLLSRNIQLPPLAFRQLEQAYWDKNNDTETLPRPMTLPLRIPPLIAVTAAESSSMKLWLTVVKAVQHFGNLIIYKEKISLFLE
ncbi:cAMP-specific 3',5'-cyclic phosphodiesterase 4D-like [Corapipo altera]|uniref:cAMP-specific 3',5'-cyclic phosphodiesterase 4D-like n=1 Tax=Corapipo altera TaxID=415028 RepID=UPI000FD63035|nr:cAMP-specific 3',5'-cyclic phosphodiesterase 4D-like [Corapipo altera]XP_027490721.1 cAMP-specific 3',5'-cyclic phosphodiesterase 4D-like [Corapipo altera]XP_027490722.1 cAMP-specific 3',5'-cyclic phosphodiesterase 4D-like [Corapipo altera]